MSDNPPLAGISRTPKDDRYSRWKVFDNRSYGMTDLDRLERMVLRGIVRDFFLSPDQAQDDLDPGADPDDDDTNDEGEDHDE